MKKMISRIVDLAYKAKEGHIPSSLSILNILDVLYGKILNDSDHFILSKGHASLGLYVVLEKYGLLDDENLDSFCQIDSLYGGHPSNKIRNVKSSTGSLGHGLPIGIGLALGEKIKGTNNRTFVIIGDGESNEGTIWESALLAPEHNLKNLYCIMDYNKSNNRALNVENVTSKFSSFNWHCLEIDGHDENQIFNALNYKTDKPVFILANTIKGYGISRMKNNHEWHHKVPSEEEYKSIKNELNEKTIN